MLDTSVFIAGESGRVLGELPERVAVSVVTIGELKLGVLNVGDAERRRQVRLAAARSGAVLVTGH